MATPKQFSQLHGYTIAIISAHNPVQHMLAIAGPWLNSKCFKTCLNSKLCLCKNSHWRVLKEEKQSATI